MLCYLPALRDGFALDDVPIIRDNLPIHFPRRSPAGAGASVLVASTATSIGR